MIYGWPLLWGQNLFRACINVHKITTGQGDLNTAEIKFVCGVEQLYFISSAVYSSTSDTSSYTCNVILFSLLLLLLWFLQHEHFA